MTLANGIAFGDRTIGNLARPFFPDGINTRPNGPLSKPFAQWSPFSTGLQLELSLLELAKFVCKYSPTIRALLGVASPATCPGATGSCTAPSVSAVRNGLQIFAGGVPIYRGGVQIGAIGVSGDGIDQDDMVTFLGLHNAGVALGGAIGNAPAGIRGDTVSPGGGNLRYVSCPVTPFLDSTEQNPCSGK
jgi:hypothetical protein